MEGHSADLRSYPSVLQEGLFTARRIDNVQALVLRGCSTAQAKGYILVGD